MAKKANSEAEEPRYVEVTDDFKGFFQTIYKKKAIPFDLHFIFVGDTKAKRIVEIKKLSDLYQGITGAHLLIIVNEDLFDKMDDAGNEILIVQEIDKITVNSESGKIKMVKPNLVTFSSLVNVYGIEAIQRANMVETMTANLDEDFA